MLLDRLSVTTQGLRLTEFSLYPFTGHLLRSVTNLFCILISIRWKLFFR